MKSLVLVALLHFCAQLIGYTLQLLCFPGEGDAMYSEHGTDWVVATPGNTYSRIGSRNTTDLLNV